MCAAPPGLSLTAFLVPSVSRWATICRPFGTPGNSSFDRGEMNADLFKDMIAAFTEAKKYRAGRKARLRVSHLAVEWLVRQNIAEPWQSKQTSVNHYKNRFAYSHFREGRAADVKLLVASSLTPRRSHDEAVVWTSSTPSDRFPNQGRLDLDRWIPIKISI